MKEEDNPPPSPKPQHPTEANPKVMEKEEEEEHPTEAAPTWTFRKEHYFFYGSLMDPSTLARILQLPSPPNLRPAQIVNFVTKLWGPYPAVVDGPTGSTVQGMAYEVQSSEEAERLQFYETEVYEPRACLIRLLDQDGRKVAGKVFVWCANKGLLSEGKFDLKDWQMRRLEEDLE